MLIDSIELSRKEGLDTPAQLHKRLDAVGSDLSRTRSALAAVSGARDNMKPLAIMISDYKSTKKLAEAILGMEDSREKREFREMHADVLERYKAAKKTMNRNHISDEAAVIDFDKRYYKICRDVESLEEKEKELREHYRRLKKLGHSLLLAEDPKFIYGPEYPDEGYTFYKKEKAREQPKKLWDKIVDAETRAGAAYDAGGAESEKGDVER